MASKKIEIDIVVNGKMQKATVSAKKLRKALDGAGDSTDKLGKSARTTDRNLKGAAQASANGTKNFSKMAQGIGGFLVPAYATLAANVFAVTAAFNAFRNAAQLEQLESSLIRTGALAGQNLQAVANGLRSITDNAIDTEGALRATAQGVAQGFSTKQLNQLTMVAKGASIALGRELPDALDRLIRGTAKLEPEILDELGIIVRLDQAAEDYAVTIGKTADQLTQFEKQQAFANAVTEQGLKKFGDIAKIAEANPYDKLAATFMDLKKNVFDGLNTLLGGFVGFLSSSPMALGGVVAVLAGTIISQLTPALSDMAANGADRFAYLAKEAEKAAKAIETKYGKALKKLEQSDISPKGFKDVEAAIRAGTADPADLKKAERSLTASAKKRKGDLEKLKEVGKGLRGSQRDAHLLYMQEKEAELGIIERQKLAVLDLQNIQKTGQGTSVIAGSAALAQNTGVRAAQAGVESQTFDRLNQAGLFAGLGIALEGTKELNEEGKKAEGVFEKIKAKGRTAGGSIKFFGSAFLRFIPYVGLAVTALQALIALFNKIFGDPFKTDPMVEAGKEIVDNLSNIQTSALEVELAMIRASTATEAAFINLKGSTGIVNQVGAAFTALAAAANKVKSDKITELQQRLTELGGMRDSWWITRAFQGEFTFDVRGKMQELKEELIDEARKPIKIPVDVVTAITESSRTQLLGAGFDAESEAVKELDKILTQLEARRGKALSIAEVSKLEKQMLDLTEASNRFIKSLEQIPNTFAEIDKAFASIAKKSNTAYTPMLNALKAQANEFKNIFSAENVTEAIEKGLNLSNYFAQQGGKSAQAFVNAVGKTPLFIDFILADENQSMGMVERVNKAFAAAAPALLEEYQATFEAADNAVRTTQDQVKLQQEAIKEYSKFAKSNRVLAVEQQFAELNIVKTKLDGLDAEEKTLIGKEKQAGVTERLAEIDAERARLQGEQKRIQEDKLTILQAEYAEAKKIADAENKLLGVRRESFDIEQSRLATRQSEELREAEQQFGFKFVDQGAMQLDQQIQKEREKLRYEFTVQKELDEIKKTMISAEYALLAEKLRVEAEISRKKGQAMLDDDDPSNDTRGENLIAAGNRLDTLATKVEAAESKAVENVDRATEARVAGIRETILSLRDAKEELEPMQQVLAGFEETMTTGMTNAITGLISGTTTAREALSNLVGSMIQVINEMIARLIVARILASAIFGGSLGGNQVDGAGFDAGYGTVNTYDFNSNPAGQLMSRYGGMFSNGRKVPGYAVGGVASGPQAGYPAVLHGTEAVVPLPNNRAIPVDLKSSGQQMNNVTVNVAIDGEGNAKQDQQANTNQGAELGKIIATAVQQQLLEEKRSGGILNPYGVS